MNIKMPWLHTAQEFSLQQRGVDTLSSKYLRQQSTASMWAHIPMTPWHSMTVDYIILTTIDYGDMMTLFAIICNYASVSWRHLNLGRRLKSCRQSRCWKHAIKLNKTCFRLAWSKANSLTIGKSEAKLLSCCTKHHSKISGSFPEVVQFLPLSSACFGM